MSEPGITQRSRLWKSHVDCRRQHGAVAALHIPTRKGRSEFHALAGQEWTYDAMRMRDRLDLFQCRDPALVTRSPKSDISDGAMEAVGVDREP